MLKGSGRLTAVAAIGSVILSQFLPAHAARAEEARLTMKVVITPITKMTPQKEGGSRAALFCPPVLGTYFFNRHESCVRARFTVYWYRVNPPRPPVLVGTTGARITNHTFLNARENTYRDRLTFDNIKVTREGFGVQAQTTVGCTQPCRVTNGNTRIAILRPGATIRHRITYRAPVPRNQERNIRNSYTFRFVKPGFGWGGTGARSLNYRCDHALPGRTRPGCVFPQFTPVMVYRMNGPYSELARHIRAAQASGLPARLRRHTNAADINRNRNRACPNDPRFPRPPGKSCDEYPMASTKEGAWTASPRPNPPPRLLRRTFDWCEIKNVPFRLGPRGFSMCMIDEDHNEDGGNALEFTFYRTKRVLDGDPFIVNTS